MVNLAQKAMKSNDNLDAGRLLMRAYLFIKIGETYNPKLSERKKEIPYKYSCVPYTGDVMTAMVEFAHKKAWIGWEVVKLNIEDLDVLVSNEPPNLEEMLFRLKTEPELLESMITSMYQSLATIEHMYGDLSVREMVAKQRHNIETLNKYIGKGLTKEHLRDILKNNGMKLDDK